MVYRWGFACLDYSFDILISWSRKPDCTVGFAMFSFIGFYFRFLVLLLLYYICLHSALPPVFYSTSLLLLSYHTMSIFYLISLTLYLLAPVCLCPRHSFHVYDPDLLIHVCLSMLAIWLSHHHSPGSWLLWILMSRFWSLERVDSPSCWAEWRSGSVDLQQTVQSPILLGPPVRL